MIKPASLWALMKSCESSEWIGAICRALGGQDVALDFGQAQMVDVIKRDSGWMDERIEAQREKWRSRQRNHRGQFEGDNGDNGDMSRMSPMKEGPQMGDIGDNGDMSHVTPTLGDKKCHPPSVRPSVRPSVHPSTKDNTIRSVTVTVTPEDAPTTERNGNGTDINEMLRAFKDAVQADETGSAFFDAEFDPVVICTCLTGDARSQRRWRQMCAKLGEDVVRQEAFQMWREIKAGEEVRNRGAVLNARLKKLEVNQ